MTDNGWGFSSERCQIHIGQEVYYTPNHGDNGHGFNGGTTLLSVDGNNCTIEITSLVPQGSEYDYGTKVHYGELDLSVIVKVPRKHIYHYSFIEDW